MCGWCMSPTRSRATASRCAKPSWCFPKASPFPASRSRITSKPSTSRKLGRKSKNSPNRTPSSPSAIFSISTASSSPAWMTTCAGCYRHGAVRIAGSHHVPPNAMKVPDLMEELFATIQTIADPVERAAQLHHGISRIHPFTDGNGRAARLAMNFVLLAAGYPPISIPTDRPPGLLRRPRSRRLRRFPHLARFPHPATRQRSSMFGLPPSKPLPCSDHRSPDTSPAFHSLT